MLQLYYPENYTTPTNCKCMQTGRGEGGAEGVSLQMFTHKFSDLVPSL